MRGSVRWVVEGREPRDQALLPSLPPTSIRGISRIYDPLTYSGTSSQQATKIIWRRWGDNAYPIYDLTPKAGSARRSSEIATLPKGCH